MYFVDFNPSTSEVIGISPERQHALAVEINDELGRKFEDGVENFFTWRVNLVQGSYIFEKKQEELVSNKNIIQVPNTIVAKNYIKCNQEHNKINLSVVGDQEYVEYVNQNTTIINIFVTEKNNPYALLNTMYFMLQEIKKGLEYEFDTDQLSLYMNNPAYTFVHIGK